MTNEPAFPSTYKTCIGHDGVEPVYAEDTNFGMTLRDYFAAKAMQGVIAQALGTALGSDPKSGAVYAYQMADAMIAERDRGETK